MSAFRDVAGFFGFILKGLRSTAASVGKLPFRISFAFFWLLALLFLLFNAQTVYGENAGQFTTILLLYIGGLALVYSQTGQTNPLTRLSAAEFLITFSLWLAIGAVLFKLLAPFNTEPPVLTTENIGLLLTHALVVAIGEELLFRSAIPYMIRGVGTPMVGMTISAFAFGFMHYTAYGGELTNLLFASGLGLVFGAIALRFNRGIVVSSALHAAWNLSILGFI